MAETHTARRQRIELRLRIAEVAIAFLVFVASVIFGSFAYKQWRTMKRQLRIQEDQGRQLAKAQEQTDRPWLIVESIKLDRPLEDGKGVAVTVFVINTGRTPANGVVFGSSIDVTDKKIVSGFQLTPTTQDSQSVGVVAPGAPPITESLESQYLLGTGGSGLIDGGKGKVIVRGKVRYDIPHGRGETGFCAIYDSRTKGFSPYSEGNYAK